MLAKRTVRSLPRNQAAGRSRNRAKDSGADAAATMPGDSRAETSRPPAPSKELLELGRALSANADPLVDRLLGMVRDLPEYRHVADEKTWTEIRQILRVNTPVFYSVVIDGRLATDEEVSAARYFARRRVHQGVPLRGHLAAYRNGMWLLWGELVSRVSGRPELQRELLLRAAWAFRHLETLSAAVTEAYYSEQEGQARHRDRTLRDLFDEILAGGPSSIEELKARAHSIAVDLDRDFRVVVLTPRRAGDTPTVLPSAAVAITVAQSAGLTVEQIIAVERNRELLIVVPSCGPESEVKLESLARSSLAEALVPGGPEAPEVAIGVSGDATGIEGVRQAYREARRAIEIGRVFRAEDFLYFYESWVLHDVLEGGASAGRRLVSRSLGPLLERGETGRRLVETLESYFRAGANLKVAAGMLGIHPNTLAYRMRQIETMTQNDPSDPEDRLRLEIALRLLAIERKKEENVARGEVVGSPATPAEKRPPLRRVARRG